MFSARKEKQITKSTPVTVAASFLQHRLHHLRRNAERRSALHLHIPDDVGVRVVRVHPVLGLDDAAAPLRQAGRRVRRRQRRVQPGVHLCIVLLREQPGAHVLAG